MYNQTTNWIPMLGTFFVFCPFVLTWLTLLVGFKRPNWKLALGPRGGDIQLFNPFPLYCFTLIFYNLFYPMMINQSSSVVEKYLFWGKFMNIFGCNSHFLLKIQTLKIRKYFSDNILHFFISKNFSFAGKRGQWIIK